jgi:hypothetical protein
MNVPQRLIETGQPWPISGDEIARERGGIRLGGLVGVVDWDAKAEEEGWSE